MRETNLEVAMVPVSELLPYGNNAKRHTEAQVEHIANSISLYGFNDPIGIWRNASGQPEIVTGHGALMAAKKLGMEEVPCTYLDHLTDEERRVYCHVHNQTQLETGFDFDALTEDICNLNADWENLGFSSYCTMIVEGPSGKVCPECGGAMAGDTCPGCGWNEGYGEFTEKFAPKKTTDDCYTPPKVFEAVAGWVADEYGVERSTMLRPFKPGGDYENEEYPDGCCVVDNPPFSILAEIIRFYVARGIPFFLFAPTLTLFSARGLDITYIPTGVGVTYENGASVNTSFITNLDTCRVRTAPTLYQAVDEANSESLADGKAVLPKYEYPDYVITAAIVARWSKHGVDYRLDDSECVRISELDAQKEYGKAIFGGGSY